MVTMTSFLVKSAAVAADPGHEVNSNPLGGENTDRRRLAFGEDLVDVGELVDKFVHENHPVKELFVKWCHEDQDPKKVMKRTRYNENASLRRPTRKKRRNAQIEALYKAYMSYKQAKRLSSRNLAAVDCNFKKNGE
ncbi:unnamed protein product [Peronospora belbahrii]|uniref:Uncharacterized protein n=1 Tax=Peronospora belbahrii TaxID=622444 RepID=A0ABN8D799_9STRA|nr:unnamed protein product [Peronospora belbahrii]